MRYLNAHFAHIVCEFQLIIFDWRFNLALRGLLCSILRIDHLCVLLQIANKVEPFSEINVFHEGVRQTVTYLFHVEEAQRLSYLLAVHALPRVQRTVLLFFV